MSIPINQEHTEAEQASTNFERDNFIDMLPPEERAKFDAVTKAVNILLDAGILFYIFPYLPSLQYKGKMQVWQWNSLCAEAKYDTTGKLDDASKEQNGLYHKAFFSFIFDQFANCFNGDTLDEKLDSLPYFMYSCMKAQREYLAGKKKEQENE